MATNGNFNGLTAAKVVGTLRANDAVPVTLAEQLRGSLRTVATIAERDAIPGRKLDNGMIVFIESTGTHYVYKNGTRVTTTGIMSGGNWSTFTSGSGGGSGAGLQEFSASSSYSDNDVVLFGGSFYFTDRDIVTTGTCAITGSTDKTNQTAAQCSTDGGTFTADDRPNPGATITTLINGGFSGNRSTITVDSTADFPYAGVINLGPVTDGVFASTFVYTSSTSTTFVGESQAVGSVADNSTVQFDNPWNIVTLSLVEKWDGSTLIDTDGQALTGSALITAQSLSRTSLGGVATESVDGFMSKEDKEQINDLPPSYKTLTEYAKATQVSFNGSIYVAHVDITDTNTDEPTTLSKWRSVDDVSISPATASTTQFGININTEDDGVVIPGATELAAGVMSAEDKIQINDLPETYIATKEYDTLDQVSLDGDLYVYFSVVASTGNSPLTANSDHWNKLGGVDLVSSTTINTGSVTIQNTAGVDAVIAPADSNNPGVMPAADKVNLDALPNEWVTGTVYTEGDQVSHDNIIYSVINDHTSVGNGIPNETNYSPLGADTVIPVATRSIDGLLTSTDKRKVDTIPTEWNSTTAYGGASLVSLNDIIYVSLKGSTNQQPAVQGIIYTVGEAAVGTVNIVAVVGGVSTTLSTFTTGLGTTVASLVDGLVANFSSSEYTIAENSAGTGVSVTRTNDTNPFTLLSDVLNTGFTANGFNATAEFWQEELEYITSRGVNVLANDPTNPFDGQVWYNSTEDLVKYFSAIDTTSQTECEANGGTFTSGTPNTCSISGVTEVVSHTARTFETTPTAQADLGIRAKLKITSNTATRGVRINFSSDGSTYPIYQSDGTSSENFISLSGASDTVGILNNNLIISNGTNTLAEVAIGIANEITSGSAATNGGGLVWNFDAIVDPDDDTSVIFSNADSSKNLNITFSDLGFVTGLGVVSRFSPNWTVSTIASESVADIYLPKPGQRFIRGSLVSYTPSAETGIQAYIYLGDDYTTTSSDNSGETDLNPEENTQWGIITAMGEGGISGISQSDADSLYYRRGLVDAAFATKTEIADFARYSDLGIRDVPGEDSVLYHSGFAFQNPADLDEVLIVNTPIDSTTELVHVNMHVIRTNISDINSTVFTVTWGGVSQTFILTLGVFSGVLTFAGLTPGTTSNVTISKSDGGTLGANLKVVLDHAGTVVSTPATNIFLGDTIDAKLVDYDTEAVADGKYLQSSALTPYDTEVIASGKYATTLQGQTADNALQPDDVRPDVNISVHHAQVDSRVSGGDVFLSADLEDFHSQITQISTHITQNTAALDDYVQFKYYALRDDVKHNSLAWRFVQNPSGYVGAWDTTTSYAGISTVVSHDDFFWSSLIGIAGTNIGLTPGTITATPLVDLGIALISDFPFTDLAGTNDLRFGTAVDAIAFMVAVNGTDATFTAGPRLKLRAGINGAPQDFGGATFTRVSGEANRIAVTNGSGGQVLVAGTDLRYQLDSGTWVKLDIGEPIAGATSWSQMNERPIASDLILTNNVLKLLDGFDDGFEDRAIGTGVTFYSWADYAEGGLYVSDATISLAVENTLGVDVTITATVINLSYKGTNNHARVVVSEDTVNNILYSDTIYESSVGVGGVTLDANNKITNAKVIARGE